MQTALTTSTPLSCDLPVSVCVTDSAVDSWSAGGEYGLRGGALPQVPQSAGDPAQLPQDGTGANHPPRGEEGGDFSEMGWGTYYGLSRVLRGAVGLTGDGDVLCQVIRVLVGVHAVLWFRWMVVICCQVIRVLCCSADGG